ncbi:PRD domain-containing protein [Haloimpatiens massiliensis]|uniref:PRD domain-containing protein n=1 Tax=Haloimpatiens massiliensis TaxID=1658110 RepID=UPI000C855E18|nr:PRD domain-containing protein [Haloimpatiens massiliensis]
MILTQRQKLIVQRLLLSKKSITAKTLSEEFDVSLRTIRYDLEDIEYWVNENGAIIEKVPRVGIKILKKEKALEALSEMNLGDNIILSPDNRKIIIVSKLVYSDEIITSEQLADLIFVSRSTVLSTIKEINEELLDHSISIEGKPHHGFKLSGEEGAIRLYIREVLIPLIIKVYGEEIFKASFNIFNKSECKKADEVIGYIKDEFNIRINTLEELKLKLIVLAFIKRIRLFKNVGKYEEEVTRYKTTKIYWQTINIYKKIQKLFNIPYVEEEIAYFSHVLLSENMFLINIEKEGVDEEKLNIVVEKIVQYVYEHLNIKENELETLNSEIINHLRLTIKRYDLNIISKNPILEQIKAKYGDVFEIARKTAQIFKEEYLFELSEDEIGFITMYFVKSLEKSKTYVKKNVVVVCNTSRGTSKLLATRIKNNIPEINIKDIVSVINIEKDKDLLGDVDLVISTIKIDNLHKPAIIVSPIITMYELSKIRDFLYLESEYMGEVNKEEEYIDEVLTNVMLKYIPKKHVSEFYKEIKNIGGFISNKKLDIKQENFFQFSEFMGLILVEFGELFQRIFPNGLNTEEFRRVYGILIHLIMAIPRWQRGEFTEEKQLKHYEKQYKTLFKMIEETFKNIYEKYNLKISKTEVVSILRYLN